MRLAFSIPVHEKNDVIEDSLRNIFRYNPDSYVVLHVSQSFGDFDAGRFEKMPGVFINSKRYVTGNGRGFWLTHCANFRHLQSVRDDWDFFCISSSNEMFIRPGLMGYVSEARNGFQAVAFDLKQDRRMFYQRVDQHPRIRQLLTLLGTENIYGGQAEGQFFEKSVMSKIAGVYFSVFGETELNDFDTEEVVPQTAAMALGVKPALPFTLVDYTHDIDFKFTEQNVALLADAGLTGRVKLNLGEKRPYSLFSPHLNGDNRFVFSVKRVPREINDPLRVFINRLPAPRFDGSNSGAQATAKAQPGPMVDIVPHLWRQQLRRTVRLPWHVIFLKLRMRLAIRTRLKALFGGVRNTSGCSHCGKHSNN